MWSTHTSNPEAIPVAVRGYLPSRNVTPGTVETIYIKGYGLTPNAYYDIHHEVKALDRQGRLILGALRKLPPGTEYHGWHFMGSARISHVGSDGIGSTSFGTSPAPGDSYTWGRLENRATIVQTNGSHNRLVSAVFIRHFTR